MAKILTVQANTAPTLTITLQRSGAPINLTGCSIDLFISLGGTIINTGHTSGTISSPNTAGIFTYALESTDTATPGTATCEARITYSDTTTERIYQTFTLQIRANLGD